MKLLLSTLLVLSATTSFAAGKCESKIAEIALAQINQSQGFDGDSVDTRTITGVKALHTGGWLENYVVIASDEVEPSEWLMIVDSKTCAVQYLEVTNDGHVSDIWD